jgi:16S rRNA G527 N7-methylase RsmG
MAATGWQAGRQTDGHLLLFYKIILKFSEEINLLHLKHTSTLSADQDGQYSK